MWWYIAIFVVSLVAAYFFMPKPEVAEPPEVQEVDIPTVEDGKTIPVLFGTRDTEAFNVVWWGDVNTRSFKVSGGDSTWYLDIEDVHGGYRYFLGLHAVLFHGPIDHIIAVKSDDKIAWVGEQADGVICDIGAKDFYGDVDAEGGFGERTINWDDGDGDWPSDGCLEILMGYPDQPRNWYLEHNLDGGDAVGDTGAHEIPAFRGVVSAVFNRFYIGNAPQLRKILFRGQRIDVREDGAEQWYPSKAAIFGAACTGVGRGTARTEVAIDIQLSGNSLRSDLASDVNESAWTDVSLGLRDIFDVISTHVAPDAAFPWKVHLNMNFTGTQGSNSITYYDVNETDMDTMYTILDDNTEMVIVGAYVAWWALYQDAEYFFTNHRIAEEAERFSLLIHHGGQTNYVGLNPYEPTAIGCADGSNDCHDIPHSIQGAYDGYSRLNEIENVTQAWMFGAYWHRADPCPSCSDDFTEGGGLIQGALSSAAKQIEEYMLGEIGDDGFRSEDPQLVDWLPNPSTFDWKDGSTGISTPIVEGEAATGSVTGYPSYDDMNPAHIIRECITNPDWGEGGDELSPDEEAFVYAADMLHGEGMGVSIKWTSQTSINDFIDLVKRHINAELYPDHATGKRVLKLIRDDYTVSDLLVLGESEIVKVENAKRPLISELINSVTVQYWDSCLGKDASVTVSDQALISLQGATINTTVQYPGFTHLGIASRAASRDLRSLSSQPLSCTIYANRSAENLNLGSVFVFHWPDLEIDGIVMRVQGIDFGDSRSNTIKLDVVEDVFGMPATIVVDEDTSDPSWVSPSQPPVPVDYQIAVEAPYYELLQVFGSSVTTSRLAATPTLGYVIAGAAKPENAINASCYTNSGSSYINKGTLQFCCTFVLSSAVDTREKVWGYSNAIDINLLGIGTHLQIDNELVSIESVDTAAETITVGRAVLDTSPRNHVTGARAFAWDNNQCVDRTEYIDTQTVDVKVLPSTGQGLLALEDATEMSATMTSRAIRPYPPANLRIDGSNYSGVSVQEQSFEVTWAHRDRLSQGAGTLIDHLSGDIGPEAGVIYTLQVVDQADTIKAEYIGLTGTSQTVVFGVKPDGLYTVKLFSTRDSVVSWQEARLDFNYIAHALDYLLQATFQTDDQVYIHGQNLDTSAEGVQKGKIIVRDIRAEGEVAISSNEMTLSPSNAEYNGLGVYGTAYTRKLGLALFVTIQADNTSYGPFFGWNSGQEVSAAGIGDQMFHFGDTGHDPDEIALATYSSGGEMTVFFTAEDYVDYRCAIILGGYDSSSLPWNGTNTGYDEGCAYFIKGGEFTNWTRLGHDRHSDDTPMYPSIGTYSPIPDQTKVKYMAVPDLFVTEALQPLVMDSFTDTNGTLLTNHTPETDVVGNGWSMICGTQEIISNRVRGKTLDTQHIVSVIDTGVSDVYIECTLADDDWPGIALRCTGSSKATLNGWQIWSVNANTYIREYVDGQYTTRASASQQDSSSMLMTVNALGQEIMVTLRFFYTLSYGFAASNEDITTHGMIVRDLADYQTEIDSIVMFVNGAKGELEFLGDY